MALARVRAESATQDEIEERREYNERVHAEGAGQVVDGVKLHGGIQAHENNAMRGRK